MKNFNLNKIIKVLSILIVLSSLFSFIFLYRNKESHKIQSQSLKNQKARDIASSKKAKPLSALNSIHSKLPIVNNNLNEIAEFQTELNKINSLTKCYDSEDCDFPKTDPRSYEIALGKKLATELKNINGKFKSHPNFEKQLILIAREHILNQDGFVQEAALEILSSLPIHQDNLNAILAGVKDTPNPLILQQSLNELSRYVGTSMENQVHEFLQSTIQTGAQLSSIAASEVVQNFINQKNFSDYQKTLSQMNPQSKAAQNLKTALNEYSLKVHGG